MHSIRAPKHILFLVIEILPCDKQSSLRLARQLVSGSARSARLYAKTFVVLREQRLVILPLPRSHPLEHSSLVMPAQVLLVKSVHFRA